MLLPHLGGTFKALLIIDAALEAHVMTTYLLSWP
jgi:hypothetical protein